MEKSKEKHIKGFSPTLTAQAHADTRIIYPTLNFLGDGAQQNNPIKTATS